MRESRRRTSFQRPETTLSIHGSPAGRSAEYEFNVHYMKTAQPTTRHWNLAGGHHTRGLREYPAEYERRVVDFFAQSL